VPKIQQTVCLPSAVHDQLRELAFAERVKMHSLLMEGLDLVFKSSGPEAIVRAYEDPMTPLRADQCNRVIGLRAQWRAWQFRKR